MTSDNKFSHLKQALRSRRIYVDPNTGEPLPRQLRADQLHPHPDNPKHHPEKQHEMVAGSLDTLGQIDAITINFRNGMIVDGHERAWLALGYSDSTLVDVDYVDLSEDEHKLALAVYDETGRYAQYDRDSLDSLLRQVNTDNASVQAMLTEMASSQGLYDSFNPMTEWTGMPEFEQDSINVYHSIKVHFNNAEDLAAFAKLVQQTVTDKTTYIYYPKQQKEDLKQYTVFADES